MEGKKVIKVRYVGDERFEPLMFWIVVGNKERKTNIIKETTSNRLKWERAWIMF